MPRSSLTIAALLFALPAQAQDGDWSYRATLYGWLPAMSTAIETRFGTLEHKASGSDVLDSLDMAFMGTFAAQHGNLGLVGDLLYTDLSNATETPFDLFGEGQVGVELTALSGYALYRVSADNPVQFDIGAGFRSFDVTVNMTLTPGRLPGRSQTLGKSWVDPLIAARLTVPLDDRWFLNGFADFGGTGGNDQTWQVYAGVGYNFNEAWSMQVGYRQMEISNTMQGRDVDIGLGGGLIGVSYSF